jgi:hypothetical protein
MLRCVTPRDVPFVLDRYRRAEGAGTGINAGADAIAKLRADDAVNFPYKRKRE